MDIILYNPLSRNGKNLKVVSSLQKKLKKKNIESVSHSILEISDIKEFMKDVHENDRFIIVGGDGTLSRLANAIYDYDFPQEIYSYKAGTGNDFIRSIKARGRLVPIKKYLKNLPIVTIDNEFSRRYLNGAGVGLDARVCYNVNNHEGKKGRFNYFRQTIRAFKQSKKVDIHVCIDCKMWTEKDAWFAAIMNSPYEGGGMKLAPKADRENGDLYLVVVKKLGKGLLPFILPTAYLGLHVIFKRYVKIYKGKDIKVILDDPGYLQVDGETEYPVRKIRVKSFDIKDE